MTTTIDQKSLAQADEAQQMADAIGEEPCVISPDCENTGPNGVCKGCREHFVRYFKNRGTYERIAFGFTADERKSYDRAADLIFGKVAPLAVPEKAKHLVAGGDPQAIKVAEEMLQMDDQLLVETVGAHKANVEKIEAQAREMIDEYAAPSKAFVQIGSAVIVDRILERRGKKLPSDTFKVELTAAKEIDRRLDVLLQLFDILPESALEGSLWISGVDATEVVKDPEKLKTLLALGCKPLYSMHAGNLRKLGRDYGGKVSEIIDNGLIDTFKTPQLVFEPLESAQKNVTPPKTVH